MSEIIGKRVWESKRLIFRVGKRYYINIVIFIDINTSMIQETNFNDIRRNYILASVLLMLFLLYWNKITIEQLFIFKFNINWNWAIFSAYWDILIILLLFFWYTLARYYIYGIEEIRKNQYNQLLLIDILKKVSSRDWNWYKEINCHNDKWELQKFDRVTIDNSQSVSKNYNIMCGNNFINQYWNCPQQITNLQILDDRIKFSDVEIVFQSQNIKKDFWPWFLNLLLRKEFSDFLWPLGLMVWIWFILVIKTINYLIHLVYFI
jgi:hypothetical protein